MIIPLLANCIILSQTDLEINAVKAKFGPLILKNLELEGITPTSELWLQRMSLLRSPSESGRINLTFPGGDIDILQNGLRLLNFSDRSGIDRKQWQANPANPITVARAEEVGREFFRLAGAPAGMRFKVDTLGRTYRVTGILEVSGHLVDQQWVLWLNSDRGFLSSMMAGSSLDFSGIKAPRITAVQATEAALAEYASVGAFPEAEVPTPRLIAGIPIRTEEMNGRIQDDAKVAAAVAAGRALSYWMVRLGRCRDTVFQGEMHFIQIDAQTGKVIGEGRVASFGGAPTKKEAAVTSWRTLGSVSVIGVSAVGKVEPVPPKGEVKGRKVVVRAGKRLFAAFYDARSGILWRAKAKGGFEAGKPTGQLAVALGKAWVIATGGSN